MEEVEKHFRQAHLPNIIKQIESVTLTGTVTRNIRDRELARLARNGWEEQNRFPLQLATTLSQQFASRGLQFFKVNKTLTHVAVARPHFLDLEATPVSDGVKRIVDLINDQVYAQAVACRPRALAEGSCRSCRRRSARRRRRGCRSCTACGIGAEP